MHLMALTCLLQESSLWIHQLELSVLQTWQKECLLYILPTLVQKTEFSNNNSEIGKPCQRFNWMLQSSSGPKYWWRMKHSVKRFSDLKVGIRELFFPYVQEPTEKQPLRFQHLWSIHMTTWRSGYQKWSLDSSDIQGNRLHCSLNFHFCDHTVPFPEPWNCITEECVDAQ